MAQKNRANMLTDIVSNIYNNLINFITGQNAQDRFVNLLDSSPNILSDASQPNGYVSTDANNEMFSSYYDEEISRADLITDLTANLAVGGKFYRINDAVGSTITLLVIAESNINLYSFGIDATTGEIGTYDITTDVFSPIVSSAQTLAQTLILGNTSGANDIEFDATQGLLFDNASRLREGTIDAGLGGLKGIAQICGAGYELKWENGRLYVMGSSGNTIRQSLYNLTTTPTTSDDASLGYQDGSLWTLDNGDTYECIDAALGTWVNKGNAYIIEITSTDLAGLEGASALSLTTIYIVTDAPYRIALKAEAVNKIGANGTIIDLTYSGSVYYDLATNTIVNGTMSDIDGNTWNGCLPSDVILGGSSTKNTFYQGATSNTLGTGNYLNTFEQDAANNELGINCGANTFKQYANGFIFGGGLQNVTIEANTTGANYTAVGYNFMYSQNYPATIFTDGSVNFHRYFDIPNDRIVVTNLSTLAVSYIGGGAGATPNIQQVLDEGNTSTTAIKIDNGTGNYVQVNSSNILMEDSSGNALSVYPDSMTIQNPSFGAGTIKATALANNVTFELPNKAAGTQTFAMLSDIGAGSGTVTSVGLSMPSAFSVASSPITTSGTIAVTGAGLSSQYVRGDGSLANFPSSNGGGASVNYYLNGSVSQGTFGGVSMREVNRTPIIGTGTDFTIATNGYIQSFITDANDPNQLVIPAGNWNFETYFSASSGGGSPSFYIELHKWDGATLTLIASNSATPEAITGGTTIDLYLSAIAVPQTTLALTDRLAIRIYVNNSSRTITLHTENSHLCQVITTFTTGLTALNGLTEQVQTFAVGTSGTDFAISSASGIHNFNLPTASASNRGALSSADWSAFNALKVENLSLQDGGSSIAATTYTLELYAQYAYTINQLKIISASGTCTVAVKINGVDVTGISAVSVSSTIATANASAANTVAIGDKITLVTTSNSALTNLQASLKTTRI